MESQGNTSDETARYRLHLTYSDKVLLATPEASDEALKLLVATSLGGNKGAAGLLGLASC